MNKMQTLSKNQQIIFDLIDKSSEPLKAYSILFNVQKKGIKAPLQVYRALDKLVELGKIHKIESRNAFIACQNSSCQVSKATAFSICEICEKITIFFGLSEIFRAIAAGMINIPVINNNPTILIEIAIIAAIKIVNIAFALSGFNPSASANS